MCSSGIEMGPGVGRFLAEWIVEGHMSIDMAACDVRRFVAMHNNWNFLCERVTETLGRYPRHAITLSTVNTSTKHVQVCFFS